MRSPLDIELLTIIEWQRDSLADQLIEDDTVVDALHRDVAAIQLPAALGEGGGVDRIHAEQLLCRSEVRERLLMGRIDVHQNRLFRIVTADDRTSREIQETFAVIPREPA